jgi:hypothetical protein
MDVEDLVVVLHNMDIVVMEQAVVYTRVGALLKVRKLKAAATVHILKQFPAVYQRTPAQIEAALLY